MPPRFVGRKSFAAFVALLLGTSAAGAAQPPRHRVRVLVIYQQQAETQPMREFTRALRGSISGKLGAPVEFYEEALDLDRVGGREKSAALLNYFDDKYRRHGIDVVVPVGGRALRFAVEQLGRVLPGVPVVFALCAAPQTDTASLPDYVTGRIASASRFAPTLAMARRLQPNAGEVVVIGGAGSSDSVSVAAVVRAVMQSGAPLRLTVLQGLSLDTLLPRLHRIPPRAIAIFANYRHDARGLAFEPLDIIGSIAHASAAPLYTQLMSYVGEGVVGGSVIRYDDEGTRTGRLVVRVLEWRPGERMPPVEDITESFAADSRQLDRFGLPESRLPAGTLLLFRERTAWERNRTAVLLAGAVIVTELLLIAGLLAERRRRNRAQQEAEEHQHRAEESRGVVTHMGRIALLGELTTTIAHELRQPLGAIRVNADTGAAALRQVGPGLGDEDRQLLDEIFGAIADDNALASDIITRVRAFGRREALPSQPVDLNEVCRTSARLLKHERTRRGVDVVLSLQPGLPPVVADPVQLQQVVLNLMLNAIEACAASPGPRVEVATAASGAQVEVVVRDNGPGLSEEVRRHLFESFFSTKDQGLGLGLPIVRSIVERYHGLIRADNGGEGGAVFRVILPRMETSGPATGTSLTSPGPESS